MSKRLIVLGATGSIGSNVVDVVRSHPDEFQVMAVTALHSVAECDALAKEFGAKSYVGEDAAVRAVEDNEADICVVATVGISGLRPTIMAIDKGMDIALATKEVLVMAGELVMGMAARKHVRILPVDSEHSEIFQCMQGGGKPAKLILTASGGPFLDESIDLSKVTVEQALNHPRWKMGSKVTIDSSTMMNKGFEVIEARWLFNIPVEKIDVVVHPESVVHSLVEFEDGAVLAQLGLPDMRIPIQYALSWPNRLPASLRKLDLSEVGSLTFRKPNAVRFPCLRLANEACRRGGGVPAVMAAADELAVGRFINREIGYLDIAKFIESCMDKAPQFGCDSVDAVYAARDWVDSWK